MILKLPPKTLALLNSYLNLKIGKHTLPTPYFMNKKGYKRLRNAIYLGKGLPQNIEKATEKLIKNRSTIQKPEIKKVMLEHGLGIDCSGFAARLLNAYLQETHQISLTKIIKPTNTSIINRLRHHFRPYTNLSANTLTSLINCIKINNPNNLKPGDFIRAGKEHVGIITKVEKKEKNLVIHYAHSLRDFSKNHGVRTGTIKFINPHEPYEKQAWEEKHFKSTLLSEYLSAPPNDRGFRRLRYLNFH